MPSAAVDRRLPRGLHPGAWWLWAIGLSTAATRTRNPLLLLLVVAVAASVVAARRTQAPWSRAFVVFLKLGLIVIAIRTAAHIVFAPSPAGTILFTLPEANLPSWAAGLTLGGEVTDLAVVSAVTDGLRLAVVLCCIGAANALANPKRLLASLPAALYEVGVAVVVALSFAPSLVTSTQRIRAARRLRGRSDRGIRGMISVALPVLEDAFERSLALAAAMDSRGYGRRAAVPRVTRRLTSVLTLAGLGGTALGMYGLLDGSAPDHLGVPVLAAGVMAAAGGLALGGRRTVRSRYRPDPWRAAEWVTAGSGVIAAAGTILAARWDPGATAPELIPLTALPLPWIATLGILVALGPAVLTPPPPSPLGARPERIASGVPA